MPQRVITSHIVNPANDQITITVMDEPGQGGACHKYLVEFCKDSPIPHPTPSVEINFQNGPIAEAGVNGLTQEVLLAICIDRLEGFQKGKFKCEDNELALQYMKAAQNRLQRRTRARMERGVEGTNKK